VIKLSGATQHSLHVVLTFFVQSSHGSIIGTTDARVSRQAVRLRSLVSPPVEYGVIAALIAVAAAAILGNLGTNLSNVFSKTANNL
jgi:hypothetical protein